jgi:hypothetical protein
MKENLQNKLELNQFKLHSFKEIIEYIYTGNTKTNDIFNLIEIAHYFQMENLLKKCEEILLKSLKSNNIDIDINIFDFSIKYDLKQLKNELLPAILKIIFLDNILKKTSKIMIIEIMTYVNNHDIKINAEKCKYYNYINYFSNCKMGNFNKFYK